jgi:hypothetical protein
MPIPGTLTNFPQGFAYGLSVRGMPLLQMNAGNVYWVDNSTTLLVGQKAGSDGNRGTFLDPFATLLFALSQCQQGRGDIIFVGPGHRETIADAVTLAMNCNGVAIVGLGTGALRPTLTFTTATTANIPIRSANMSIQNFLFLNNFADIASNFTGIRASSATSTITGTTLTTVGAVTGAFWPGMVLKGTGVTPGTYIVNQLTGAAQGIGTYTVYPSQTVTSTTITGTTPDFCIENCEFRDLTSVLNALTIVTGNATANSMDGLTFNSNKIFSLGTTAATTAIVLSSATDRLAIKGNFGNWAVLNDTAAMLAAGANNMTNFEFGNNILERPNTSSTNGSFISTSATAWTGHAYNNMMYQLDNSAGIWIATGTGGAFGFSQNFSPITGAVDKSGLINPAAV